MTNNNILKEKVSKFIYDNYTRFDDSEVEIKDDGLSFDFVVYGIDDFTAEVNKDEILYSGNITFEDGDRVHFVKSISPTEDPIDINFGSWDDYILFEAVCADDVGLSIMNWCSYVIKPETVDLLNAKLES